MSNQEEKNVPTKYYYYAYHGYVAREVAGNNACAANCFDFYIDGKWINDYNLSLHLSDSMRGVCGCSVFDYEELTEDEAMRRIADPDY